MHNIKHLKKNTFTAFGFILLCIISNSLSAGYYKVTRSDISFFAEINPPYLNTIFNFLNQQTTTNSDFIIEEITSETVSEMQGRRIYQINGLNDVNLENGEDTLRTIIDQALDMIYQELSPQFRGISEVIKTENDHLVHINIRSNTRSEISASDRATATEIADRLASIEESMGTIDETQRFFIGLDIDDSGTRTWNPISVSVTTRGYGRLLQEVPYHQQDQQDQQDQQGIVTGFLTSIANRVNDFFGLFAQIVASLIRQPPSLDEELYEVVVPLPQQQIPVIFINSDKASQ